MDIVIRHKQIAAVRRIAEAENFQLAANCSHYLFVDQQVLFISFVQQNIR
ncbi:hypothetical protein HMPREF0766_12708 [Sphingobacterium spiritivorum ATCC 33861]|uniref:Uncharacterized protein n=1 Tax=Sphingobacterium spiritivorum ATCC 33861 TaxID=525373 RepID=D7VNY8_SPHSI|nr:hypothetical protein HMPREF0766_12708 [Sphingobacterium spiritivorum ATCC 33861]